MRSLLLTLFFVFALTATCQAAPVISSPPMISGQALVGQHLVAENTQVEGAMDIDLTINWERSVNVGSFVEIAGAHDTAYLVVPADAGSRLRVHVVVETADGRDESWSTATAPVARASDVDQPGVRLRLGPARNAPVALAQWVVTAGADVAVSGQLPADQLEVMATIVLEPTVAGHQPVRTPVAGDESGRLTGTIVPLVNAVAWLELDSGLVEPHRIRLGVVGVRPQIRLRLAARRDGVDAQGRTLIRDLALLPGSVVAPGVVGLRLSWEGILPGERRGTAVCRRSERVLSANTGALRGSCATRGAWSLARWRLVYDPGTSDPGSSPYLSATSVWVRPQLRARPLSKVPNLPRAYANLRSWN
jgi:hypothetical protein